MRAILHSELDRTLKGVSAECGLPAIGGVITNADNDIIYAGVTGNRKWGVDVPATIDDKFHIGSCTKAMTSTLAGILVHQKRISWSTSIGDIFSSLIVTPRFRRVTLEQLLAHRGGVIADMKQGYFWKQVWARTLDQHDSPSELRRFIVQEIVRELPVNQPGDTFLYSNAGYIIAGAMLEEVLGESWETALTTRLFEPLKMKSAGFGAPASPGMVDQPWGHSWTSDGAAGEITPKPIEPGLKGDNPPALGPAGTVHCNLLDLSRFAAWHLGGPASKCNLQLDEALFSKLHTPWTGGDYHFGWFSREKTWADGTALYHNGSNTMFYALMWLAPRKKIAMIVATNIDGERVRNACETVINEMTRHI